MCLCLFSNHVYTYMYAYVYVRTGPHSTFSKNLHRKTQLDVVITFHGIICLGSMYPRSYINPGSSFHFLWICTLIFMGSHTLSQSELHLRAIFNWPGSSTYNLASFTSSTYRFAFSSHFFLWFMQSESLLLHIRAFCNWPGSAAYSFASPPHQRIGLPFPSHFYAYFFFVT